MTLRLPTRVQFVVWGMEIWQTDNWKCQIHRGRVTRGNGKVSNWLVYKLKIILCYLYVLILLLYDLSFDYSSAVSKNRKKDVTRRVHMGNWPSLRSRWLDIKQVVFLYVFIDRDGVEVDKHAKQKEWGQYPAMWPKNLVNRGCITWDKEQIFLAGHVA